MVRGSAVERLGGTCGRLGDSYAHPEPTRRDADEPLEVVREVALVREPGAGSDLRQGGVTVALQELLGALDAAGDDVLVGRQPGGPLELRREVGGAEAGESGHPFQSRAGLKVFLDVLDDGAELCPGERAVPPGRGLAGRQDV